MATKSWLDEVKADAEYNHKKRLAAEQADRDYEASKKAETPQTNTPTEKKK